MDIFFSEYFKNQLKKLKRKYPQVKYDLLKTLKTFKPGHEISIGRSIYKLRIPSRDMQKGKSGGFRSYIFIYWKKDLLAPLFIYPKSETESITENELKFHFDRIMLELIAAHLL